MFTISNMSTGSTTPAASPRFCRRCSYDLHATPLENPRCPECGHPFDPADPRTFRRRPVRRWLRHVRRAAACLLILFLVLAAVWGWFYWGWYSDRQALVSLKLDPSNPAFVEYTPILTPWPKQHLGPAGFVLDRVVEVNLTFRSDLTDLAPLAQLTHLQQLYLADTSVSDLTPLARLTDLQELDLSDTRVTDLAPLTRLTSLQHLSLDCTGVTDLAPLTRLTNLQSLNLGHTDVADLAPLAGLTDLQTLHLDKTGVTDITPLARLMNLQELWLYGTGVTDLAPLGGLKSLRYLPVPKETISEAQADALRRTLPGCTIQRW